MSTRLNAETVEAQIREMWDALDYKPGSVEDAVNLNTAMDQAREVEAKMRARLAYQNRLDAAAPKMLQALNLAQATLSRLHLKHPMNCECIKGTMEIINDAIALTEPEP